MQRCAAALVAVLALVAAAPEAAPAKRGGGAPRAGFFGVAPFEVPSASELAHMRAGGIGTMRVGVYHGYVELVPGTYNWHYYDFLVTRAAAAGVTLSPVLFGVPPWMSPKPARMPIDSPAQEASWAAFVTAAADRYGPGGTFWTANPSLVPHPMRIWEVWNEPNISEFVAGPPTARRYARLLRITDAALDAARPPARTMVAGLYRRPNRGAGPHMNVFLAKLYRVKGVKRTFDGVGLHPYGSSPAQVMKVVRRAREIMDSRGDRRATLWITEVGWSTGGTGWAQSQYRATPAEQAQRLSRTYRALLRSRRALRLRQVTWHVWRDYDGPTAPLPGWIFQMGLFRGNGEAKPAWHAFRRITHGAPASAIPDLGREPAPRPVAPPNQSPPGTSPEPSPEPQPCLLPALFC